MQYLSNIKVSPICVVFYLKIHMLNHVQEFIFLYLSSLISHDEHVESEVKYEGIEEILIAVGYYN